MHTISIYTAIFFAFYIISAFATTDILRLLRGSSTSVSDLNCFCPVCGNRILLRDQLPIFAYFFHHGKCRYCKSAIPVSNVFLEIFLFLSLSVVSLITQFSFQGFLLCFFLYQCTKVIYLVKSGPREDAFFKNLLLSFLHNILLFGLLAFLFFIKYISGF